jgi:MFS family permease
MRLQIHLWLWEGKIIRLSPPPPVHSFLIFAVALAGGNLAFTMGLHAFISDISSPEQRSFRLAMAHFVSVTGRPVGTIIGAYLFQQGGYVCVIGSTLVGRILAAASLVIRLEMFKWRPAAAVVKHDDSSDTSAVAAADGAQAKKHSALSLVHIKDSLMTVARRRPDGKRSLLWIYLTIMLVVVLPSFGESTIGYNYVRTRFGWDMVQYSEYRTITEMIDLAGQAVTIPVLGYAQVGENNMMLKKIMMYLQKSTHCTLYSTYLHHFNANSRI